MPTSLGTPITLPTGYTQAATLGPIQNLEKIVFQNTNGVIVFQVGRLDPTNKPQFDQSEAELPPGIWGFDQIYGIRFRSRDAISPATLDPCTGYFDDDPDPYAPGTIPGAVATITGAVNIQHNDALVASQPTLDFEDSASSTFSWVVTNDGPNTRVKVTPPDVVNSFNGRIGTVVPASGDYTIAQITNAVTSVFGRNGAVVATSGDYTAAQVTNAADKSSVATQAFSGSITAPSFGTTTFYQSITSGAATSFECSQTGDTNNRVVINSAGTILFGTGSAAVDTTLARAGVGLLSQTATPSTADNSTKLATTAYVQNQGYVTTATAPVTSVFTRTGAVVAQSGDYTAAQVTNAADKSSASTQVFTGDISTGPTSRTFSGSQTTGTIIDQSNGITAFNTVTFGLINSGLTTDTVNRFGINSSGLHVWGAGGSTATDLTLQRTTKGSDVGFDFSSGTGVGWAQFSGATYHGAATTFTTGGGVTWTPDYAAGNYQAANINVSGATTLTITTPSNGPPAGETGFLIMFIENTGASGGTTLTWSGAFLNAFSSITKPTSVPFGTSVLLFFVFNSVTSGWKCVGQF